MYGVSSDEEKRLTMVLFSNIFDSLSKMVTKIQIYQLIFKLCFQDYDPDLFGKALPCLTAIGCALPPDYTLSKNYDDEIYEQKGGPAGGGSYDPQPINTSK